MFILLFTAGLLGCATAPVKETPEKTLPATEERFAEDSMARAAEFETAGKLPQALKHYKIALAVLPNDRVAKEGRDRVEKASRKGAEEHYRAGLRMQKEGRHAQALPHFLAALRLWPDYPEALQMAWARRPVLSEKQVAQKAQSPPETRERAQELTMEEGSLTFSEKAPAQEEQKEIVDQVAVYREYGMELYREGKYQDALTEFGKVLGAKPNDPVAKEYSYKSSFELAVELLQKKDYLAAKEQFLVSLKHNSTCQKCHLYIRRSEELFKEMHYKQGIEYYSKEQLAEAIMEWELVKTLDPSYKRVDYHINKAKEIQRKLEELKKESREENED